MSPGGARLLPGDRHFKPRQEPRPNVVSASDGHRVDGNENGVTQREMPDNPYATPESMPRPVSPRNRIIWKRELRVARVILILIGLIQLGLGVYLVVRFKSSSEEASRAKVASMGPGYYFDQTKFEEEFEEVKVTAYARASIPALFGVYLLVMAALVFKFPVGATLSSVILCLLGHVADLFISQSAFYQGILIKILFIAILWKAFQSARTARAALGNAQA